MPLSETADRNKLHFQDSRLKLKRAFAVRQLGELYRVKAYAKNLKVGSLPPDGIAIAIDRSTGDLQSINDGEIVILIGPNENGFSRILYQTQILYISNKYLSTTPAKIKDE